MVTGLTNNGSFGYNRAASELLPTKGH